MAYEIGVADNYTDMLDRLIDFLSNPNRVADSGSNIDELVAIDDTVQSGEPSQAWSILEFNDGRDSGGHGDTEIFMMGPGTSGLDEIYCWIDTLHNETEDYYNWRIAGMTGYAAGVDVSLQPGVTQGRLPRMLLWDDPIKYWFLGNGRRFVVIAKVSSSYEMCYGGFCLPYGLPTQFPYPMVIGGSACPSTAAASNRYTSTAADHRGFPSPYASSAGIINYGTFDVDSYHSTLKVLQGTSWVRMFNKNQPIDAEDDNIVWPYLSGSGSYLTNLWQEDLRENIDGSYPIFPTILCLSLPSNHIMGELQGVYATIGYGGIAAEDTFTIGGDTYVTFPIVYAANKTDWMTIKLE